MVFPRAECKIFLTASPAERARRRLQDLQARGEKLTFEEVLAKQNERNAATSPAKSGPLMPARDAIEVRTDGLDSNQVVDRLEALVRSRMPNSGAAAQNSAAGMKASGS